jgi:GNAT superfamily N-acetyltransferase
MEINSFYIDTECADITGFDSGAENDVFNDYLRQRYDSSVIHYVMDAETDRLVAYFSLIASALLDSSLGDKAIVPAIELKMFCLDKSFRGTGFAPILLGAVVDVIRHYAVEYVGADVAFLYSVTPDKVVQLYEKAGFAKLDGDYSAYESEFTDGCIPMYMVLQ